MKKAAIIVDDEVTLIDYLQEKLQRLWPELDIVGTAVNGRQAIALAVDTQPDIAFLDIQMPGLSGLQVAEALPETTQVVFVTAYDQFAMDAFERAAVDYLLKPVSDTRLQQTIQRLQGEAKHNHDELLALLKHLTPTTTEHLQWLRTGLEDTTELVSVDDVVFFQADQKYTQVATAKADHLIRKSIKELEQELNPKQFWRIHRGLIVRVDQVLHAKRDLRGRYALTLRDRPETLRTSTTYGHLFKHM